MSENANKNSRNKSVSHPGSQEILANANAANEAIPASGMHLFSRCEDICSKRTLNKWLRESEPYGNGNVFLDNVESSHTVEEYVKALFKYEDTCCHKRNKGVKTLYLSFFRIMMPVDLSSDLYLPFAQRFAHRILHGYDTDESVPYFLRTKTVGQCTYLLIFFSERYWYPDGREVEMRCDSDFYRNPVTGRRCSPDTEGAVLAWKKGDFIRTTTCYFSAKERITRIDLKQWKRRNKAVKWLMKDFFTTHLAPQSDDALFARLSYDLAAPKLQAKLCDYNAIIRKMEYKCTEVLDAVKFGGFDDALPTVHEFIKTWRQRSLQSDGTFRFNDKSYHYTINFKRKLEDFDLALDALYYSFEQAFDRLVKGIFPDFA